jgi:tetratricopeptide (TPR) repeat protein
LYGTLVPTIPPRSSRWPSARADAPERDGVYDRVTLGAALYRAGRAAEAIEHLELGRESDNPRALPRASLFLALAHRALGHAGEVHRQLDAFDSAYRRNRGFWWNLELELIRREVDQARHSNQ